jgi:hypothetical protein
LNDTRISVKNHCAFNFSKVLIDNHLFVPVGVLIKIYVDILIPSIMIIVQNTLLNIDQNFNAAIENLSNIVGLEYNIEQMKESYAIEESIDGSTSASFEVEILVVTLCKSVLLNLNRLVQYPSFDKLWIEFLRLFELVLLSDNIRQTDDGKYIQKRFEMLLSSTLESFNENRVFDLRSGLLEYTRQTAQMFGNFLISSSSDVNSQII